MDTTNADRHKSWTVEAEPVLRRIIRERDETIRQLEARIAELTGATDAKAEEPAAVIAFGRKAGKR